MPSGFPGEKWEIPDDELDSLLEKWVENLRGLHKDIKAKYKISYTTFYRFIHDSDYPKRLEKFKEYRKLKCEYIKDRNELLADGPEDSKDDSTVLQNRNKMQIDHGEKYLKAYDPDWKPRTEVDVTSKGEKLTNGIDELGRRAILAAAEELSAQ